MRVGVAQRVPDEQITLRYRSAIEDKYKKYRQYLEQGTIRSSDAYIVALNSCMIENAGAELNPPRIIKAVFPIGYPQITIDKNPHKELGRGHQLRYYLRKTKGSIVSTDVFINMEYKNLSGVLYSRAGIRHFPENIGGDFVFVHNPLAVNSTPRRFIPCEQEYIAVNKPDSWEIGPL
jgi:type I restriction enzyme S subunit